MSEVWKVIEEHPQYEVSNLGKVRDIENHSPLPIIYNVVSFDKFKTFTNVARLVVDAFDKENKGKKYYWKNGNQEDCRLSNITFERPKGLRKKIKRRFGEVVQLTLDGKFVAAFPNAWKAALMNGKKGANSKISDVCDGIIPNAIGYKWMWKGEYDERVRKRNQGTDN